MLSTAGLALKSFHWWTIYWERHFELVVRNWGLYMVLSRTMGDLGSAIRSNFLHFWLSYVNNIYFASETLGTAAFSGTENVTFRKEITIMEINRRFWPSRIKFCLFLCDDLPFPCSEDRLFFFFKRSQDKVLSEPHLSWQIKHPLRHPLLLLISLSQCEWFLLLTDNIQCNELLLSGTNFKALCYLWRSSGDIQR